MTTIRMAAGRVLRAMAVAAAAASAGGVPAAAQGLFAPVASVDGTTISRYQVEQRARFLRLLRAPDAGFEAARDMLIDETLRAQAARDAGIAIDAAALDRSLADFAARADLTPARFVEILGANDIATETYRDFARNGLLWRELVQQRFGPAARPSADEIERAIARDGASAPARVLFSEIAVPVSPGTRADARVLARRLATRIVDEEGFAQAARRFSAAPTAARGGRREWVAVDALPSEIARPLSALEPGEISAPIDRDDAVVLYFLRERESGARIGPDAPVVEYAELRVPTSGEAARAAALSETCDDLYGVARGAPDRLDRRRGPVESVPADVRAAIRLLDAGETTVLAAPDGSVRLVMLCGRGGDAPEGAFAQVGQAILSRRLADDARSYAEELRADAVIERF